MPAFSGLFRNRRITGLVPTSREGKKRRKKVELFAYSIENIDSKISKKFLKTHSYGLQNARICKINYYKTNSYEWSRKNFSF